MPESTPQIQVERTLKRHSVRGQSGDLTGKPPGCGHQRKSFDTDKTS